MNRRAIALLVTLGVALAVPALGTRFLSDDYVHIAMVEGWAPAAEASALDLYRFIPAGADGTQRLLGAGLLPWWTAPDLRLSFWRPLSSALFLADHTLFGRAPLPYHLHSAIWYLGMLLAAAALFRRALLGAGCAVWALLVFVVDDAHAMPVAWIAARHGLVATVPVLLGLLAHQRWRTDGWRPGAWLGPVACAAGLAASETAVAAMSYLAAWELVERRPGWRRALLPFAALLSFYLVAHRLAGAGTHGSGGYLDPLGEPLTFLGELPLRLGVLSANLLLGVAAEIPMLNPAARVPLALVGWGATALLVWWARRAARSGLDPRDARALLWLGAGAAGALVPGAASLMGERVLLPATFGAAGVVAILVQDLLRRCRERRGGLRVAAAAALALVLLVHVVAAPLLFVFKGRLFAAMAREGERRAKGIEVDPGGSADVLVLQSDDFLAAFLPLVRAVALETPVPQLREAIAALRQHGLPLPVGGVRSWRVLSLAPTAHQLTRLDDRTLVLATPEGTFFDGGWPALFRSMRRGMPAGTVVSMADMTVTVLADRAGRPTKIALRLPGSADHPARPLMVWRDGAFRRVPAPQVGETVSVPRAPPFSQPGP
jgi:hypothetical protein